MKKLNVKSSNKWQLASLSGALLTQLMLSQQASAHGYMYEPASRNFLCRSGVALNQGCGGIQNDAHSLEGPEDIILNLIEPGNPKTQHSFDDVFGVNAVTSLDDLNARQSESWSKSIVPSGLLFDANVDFFRGMKAQGDDRWKKVPLVAGSQHQFTWKFTAYHTVDILYVFCD